MIGKIRGIFKSSKPKGISGYAGLSDFLVHAPDEKKKEVIREAAKRANEDQMKTFTSAQLHKAAGSSR